MIRRLLYLAAILIVFLVAPAGASATPAWVAESTPDGLTPWDAEAEAAYQVAVEYWGGPPTDCATISKFRAPTIIAEGQLAQGVATRPIEPGEDCAIGIRSGLSTWATCAVTVHEVGHLRGLEHTTDPASPMYVGPSPGAVIPGCEAMAGAERAAGEAEAAALFADQVLAERQAIRARVVRHERNRCQRLADRGRAAGRCWRHLRAHVAHPF